MKVPFAIVLGLTMSLGPLCSFAADDEDEEENASGLSTLAVQNRHHTMTHEFSAWIGTLPLDAFQKGVTFTGAYSLHFNDFLGWEVGQFTYSKRIKMPLYDELENLQNPSAPTAFEVVRYFVTSSLIVKPAYGKLALLNRSLVFAEVFFVLGGGYGWMTLTGRPVIDVGAGMRVYAGKYLSFRLDVRDDMFVNSEDLQNELWVALGICLSID